MRSFKQIVLCACVTLLSLVATAASAWQIIVPTATEGSTDVLSRKLAQQLTTLLGEVVEVVNVPGKSGSVAATRVYQAKPDDHVLLMATVSSHAIAMGLSQKPVYPADGFSPISLIGSAPYLLVVSSKSPLTTVAQFLAKSQASSLTYSSTGIGGPHHLVGELLALKGHLRLIHKPYAGGADAIHAVEDGTVDLMLPASILALPEMKKGSVRVLATTGAKRSAQIPDIPTLQESGLTGFDAQSWYVLEGPPHMPLATVKRLEKAVQQALQNPDFLEALKSNGVDAGNLDREAINPFLAQEATQWGDLITALKLNL